MVEHFKGDYFIMSKKTLNESTIRRFMGLANITPSVSSNFLKENFKEVNEEDVNEDAEVQEEGMYGEEDEDPADAEAPPMDDAPVEEPPMDAELPPEGDLPPEEAGSPELEITQAEADVLATVLAKLTAAMPAAEEPPVDAEPALDAEPAPDMDAELPAEEEPPAEDELMEKALEETEVDLSEDEVVQEVARRVAARILKAKQAKAKMDEALGNKKKK